MAEWLSVSDNDLTGDLSPVCDNVPGLVWVDADCRGKKREGGDSTFIDGGGGGGDAHEYGDEFGPPDVECPCCSFCCNAHEEGPVSRFDLFGDIIEGKNAIGPPDDRFRRGCYLMA
uniref:Uncharacterized protein n=1 Tax=Odontella aurita TaxID=265563 RepID=A0A7S4NI07_9STRA|mmetsp:Transcript_9118/g.27341  ORF Transcript_9118/g.27341 Transcript_9118/m.27341 type:complete len:116 (+) Transcript_9118:94-441(+)